MSRKKKTKMKEKKTKTKEKKTKTKEKKTKTKEKKTKTKKKKTKSTSKKKVGAAMVVGAGIGGIQASLDLAELGFKVILVERSPAIGGMMSQLDKTFPTNDCSMCILSPKLVEAGRHHNIQIITNAEIEKLEGESGNFIVSVKKHPRYVDEEACTGCGLCAAWCPIETSREYDEGLRKRKSIFIKYPQAVPKLASIDKTICIGCRLCEYLCEAKAINFAQKEEMVELNVGAIILAQGSTVYEPSSQRQYGYGRFSNVLTSIEFERVLSASGPFMGNVLRPSDGTIPEKIAFLQCIGSRDVHHANEYCSSVCCMYTAKEAVIAKEHQPLVNPTIFSMDIRAYGKDFDKYIERAKDEYGIRYERSRISSIEEVPESKNLILTYETDEGEIIDEEFNMVVLAVGLNPPRDAPKLAEVLGIALNEYGFCKTQPFSPMETTRPGIYVCGALSSPKDIPETVVQASAATDLVDVLLSPVRGTLITKKEYPEEIKVLEDPPKIGVFICHCGINIGGVVNVPEVVEYAQTLPNVIYAERNLYTCSADTQTKMKEMIQKYDLNRVIVASCTPRTHEPLFQETIREAGLNRYLFEMANIRDQCSWVHMHEPIAATEKARDLVRMAVSKANNIEPLQRIFLDVLQKALVIGGGIAGLNAALQFAKQGYETYLIEKEKQLGGFARNIHETIERANVQEYLNHLIQEVKNQEKLKIFTEAEIEAIEGYVGNFKTRIKQVNSEIEELESGVIVIATGGRPYTPVEYHYGQDERVITQIELENKIFEEKLDEKIQKIVMIQCVGSRNEKNPYCSRICCAEAIKNAIKIKEKYPDKEIVILFRDIRTYGFKEKYYRTARKLGVTFIRFDEKRAPEVVTTDGQLDVIVDSPNIGKIKLNADIVALSTGINPPESNDILAPMLKVPLNEDNFFLEAHVKLRPVDFATEGVFVCGLAHSPKSIEESIVQACGAAARAARLLARGEIEVEGVTSYVDPDRCIGCGTCVEVCPYGAISLTEVKEILGEVLFSTTQSIINPALCKGCGACVARCPVRAISQHHFETQQLVEMVKTIFTS